MGDYHDRFNFAAKLVEAVLDEEGELSVTLETAYPTVLRKEHSMNGQEATIQVTVRRMGNDTGMDTLVHVDNVLRIAVKHTLSALRKVSEN